jgi:hypothetical protein
MVLRPTPRPPQIGYDTEGEESESEESVDPQTTPELFDIALTPFNEIATYHFDLKKDDILKRFDIVDDYAFGHPFLQRLIDRVLRYYR